MYFGIAHVYFLSYEAIKWESDRKVTGREKTEYDKKRGLACVGGEATTSKDGHESTKKRKRVRVILPMDG